MGRHCLLQRAGKVSERDFSSCGRVIAEVPGLCEWERRGISKWVEKVMTPVSVSAHLSCWGSPAVSNLHLKKKEMFLQQRQQAQQEAVLAAQLAAKHCEESSPGPGKR